jgi:hypothetical protein
MAVPYGILFAAMYPIGGISPQPGDHYVSPTGTGSWAGAVEIVTPCSPAAAMANAMAGDVTWFRGGTYNPGNTTGNTPEYCDLMPAHSGTVTAPITFIAYPGEQAVVNAVGSAQWFCLGAVYHDYITWDGFSCTKDGGLNQPVVYLYKTVGCQFKNLFIDGGTNIQTSTDNCPCVRIDESGYYTVSNCHIIVPQQTTGWHNTCGMQFYHNATPIYGNLGIGLIEHCEIEGRGVGPLAIYVKSSTDDLTIRNNYIHDLDTGIMFTPSLTEMQSDRGHVYNNLIVNTPDGAFGSSSDNGPFHGNDWMIYNNTCYNGGLSWTYAESGHGWRVYNNIIAGLPAHSYVISSDLFTARIAEWDYNQYTDPTCRFETGRGEMAPVRHGTFAAWQASQQIDGGGTPDAHSLTSDPEFVNTSGLFNTIADFALAAGSPCKGMGKAGADMGCDVTQVGVL